MKRNELIEFINLIIKQPDSPIKVFNSTTEQIVLKSNL